MGFLDLFKKKQAPAEQPETSSKKVGSFTGFALLSSPDWDRDQWIRDLKDDWNLDTTKDCDSNEHVFTFSIDSITAYVALMPVPIPNGEAERAAAANYLWKEAAETVKSHRAHLVVGVSGAGPDVKKTGELFVKLLCCCCKQRNALGIYSNATVFEPRFYMAGADMMKNGQLPILNLIWFGLYRGKKGMCCYTCGLESFGKDEMEVVDAKAQPSDVQNFLLNLTSYVLKNDVTLNHGETVGFSAEDKHRIRRGQGVSLPGITLKIEY